jgi:hypothetical protein
MTERVTVEQNGERFTLDVPDGTSDADIQSFLTQQQTGAGNPSITAPPANPVDNIATQAAIMAPAAVNQYIEKSPTIANAREAVNMAENVATKVNPAGLQEMIKNPIQTAKAFVNNLPLMNAVRNPVATAGAVARGVGSVVADPMNAVTLPYNMAAYEQAKIRENPTAPEYATNPYAQAYRSEYATQGAAAAANRRNAIANAATGYTPTPDEAHNVLQSGNQRMIGLYGGQQKLQGIAATSALAPPTAQNFIERMKRLAGQYSSVSGLL